MAGSLTDYRIAKQRYLTAKRALRTALHTTREHLNLLDTSWATAYADQNVPGLPRVQHLALDRSRPAKFDPAVWPSAEAVTGMVAECRAAWDAMVAASASAFEQVATALASHTRPCSGSSTNVNRASVFILHPRGW